MKRLLSLILVFLLLSFVAKAQKRYEGVWWKLADKCFAKNDINKKTALFIKVNNKYKAGAVFKKRTNATGRMLHPIVLFGYEKVSEEMQGMPKIQAESYQDNECRLELKDNKVYQDKFTKKIINASKIPIANKTLHGIINNSVAKEISIRKWEMHSLDKSQLEETIKDNKREDFVKELRNGERFIALKAIRLKELKLIFQPKKEDTKTLKTIKDDDILPKHGVQVEMNADETYSIIFSIKEPWFPFVVFGDITPKVGFKSLSGDIIVEPEFTRYNNLMTY